MGWYNWGYRKSRPIRTEGGVKSQSKQGGFGTSWWAKRWISVLEGFNIGARLSRGRSYARQGQVLSIAVEKGKVSAEVQGSRPRPYKVEIEVKPLSEKDWARVLDALGRQALFAAKLLAGEMPQDIEEVFKEVGLSLFPARSADLTTDCSCPDWSNPCKHIAAVYYLLGEEFDRDPSLIIPPGALDRDALTARLGAAAAIDSGPSASAARPAEPLSEQPEVFWGEPTARYDDLGPVDVPREPAALARRLGGFPFWRGEIPFLDALAMLYDSASPLGFDVLIGPIDRPEPTSVEHPASPASQPRRTSERGRRRAAKGGT